MVRGSQASPDCTGIGSYYRDELSVPCLPRAVDWPVLEARDRCPSTLLVLVGRKEARPGGSPPRAEMMTQT